MKKVKIGKKEYDQMEDVFDMNDERFYMFKTYILQSIQSLDKPLFLQAYSKIMALMNEGKYSDAIIELYNFKKAIELEEVNFDAYSICFALIHLEKDEDQRDLSQSTQENKLHEMRENGLKRGLVEEVVTNFMKTSPTKFGVYLEMLQMMTPKLMEEYLSE